MVIFHGYVSHNQMVKSKKSPSERLFFRGESDRFFRRRKGLDNTEFHAAIAGAVRAVWRAGDSAHGSLCDWDITLW